MNITELVQRSGKIITSVTDGQDDDETGEADESDVGTDEEVDSGLSEGAEGVLAEASSPKASSLSPENIFLHA